MKKTVYKNFYLILLFTLLIMLDRITKNLAVSYLKNGNPFVIIKDVFEFHYLDGGNSGAAWGIFEGKILFFIIITILVLLFIILLIKRLNKIIEKIYSDKFIQLQNTTKKYTCMQLIFVLIAAGAVGNLIDRIHYGYVIDFLYFKLINFPIFNVADCYVTVSVILLIIMVVFVLKEKEFDLIFSKKSIDKGLSAVIVSEKDAKISVDKDNTEGNSNE